MNNLFETLHDNGFDKTIDIANNPGSTDCNPSIAQAKGWTVEGFEGGTVIFDGLTLTALGIAITEGNLNTVKSLIEKGASK